MDFLGAMREEPKKVLPRQENDHQPGYRMEKTQRINRRKASHVKKGSTWLSTLVKREPKEGFPRQGKGTLAQRRPTKGQGYERGSEEGASLGM